MKKYIVVMLAFLNFGCAVAFGPKFEGAEVKSDKALVYVYREKTFYGSGNMLIPRLWLDDKKIGSMRMGGYHVFSLDPGQYVLDMRATLGGTLKKKTIKVAAGDIKFFEYAEFMTGMNSYGGTNVATGSSMFIEKTEIKAMPEIIKTKRLSMNFFDE